MPVIVRKSNTYINIRKLYRSCPCLYQNHFSCISKATAAKFLTIRTFRHSPFYTTFKYCGITGSFNFQVIFIGKSPWEET